MSTILAEIDVTTSYGMRIVRDLSLHKEYVKIHSFSDNENWHKFEDVISEGLNKMSDFYKIDMHELSKYDDQNSQSSITI